MSRVFGYSVVTLFLLAAILQVMIYYPQLPDRMASHFNAAGQADGWTSKRMFFGLDLGLQFGMAFCMIGAARLASRLPNGLINLPNKGYWLADERRADTFRHVELCMIWIAAATIALLVTVFQLTINANLTNGPLANGPVLVCIAVYFGCIVIFCLHLYRRFALPKDVGDAS